MSAASDDFAAYLRARRALVRPVDVGLPAGRARRVPGLRREEVAALADISADYYLRLEQGRGSQPSRGVLSALATALRLDEFGAEHLYRLSARMELPAVTLPVPSVLDDATREMMASVWQHTPGFVVDRNQDVLAANALVTALSPGIIASGNNLVVHTFQGALGTTGLAGEFWRGQASDLAAALRYYGDPDDGRYRQVVSILRGNPLFEELWERHDVRPIAPGPLRIRLAPYGWFSFVSQVFEIPGVWGQALITYGWEPDSPTDDAMKRLTLALEEDGAVSHF